MIETEKKYTWNEWIRFCQATHESDAELKVCKGTISGIAIIARGKDGVNHILEIPTEQVFNFAKSFEPNNFSGETDTQLLTSILEGPYGLQRIAAALACPIESRIKELAPIKPQFNEVVYLAGPMFGLTVAQARGWRDVARKYLEPYFRCFNPMDVIKELSENDILKCEYSDLGVSYSSKGIVRGDLYEVMQSQIILANLTDATSASIGTIREISTAAVVGNKLIVLIIPKGNIHNHPSVVDAGVVVETLEEAINYIFKLYGVAKKVSLPEKKSEINFGAKFDSFQNIPYTDKSLSRSIEEFYNKGTKPFPVIEITFAVQCQKCLDVIFSRCDEDIVHCSCRHVNVGGFTHLNIETKGPGSIRLVPPFNLHVTAELLSMDFVRSVNHYGRVSKSMLK
jgi:hypothetical protein